MELQTEASNAKPVEGGLCPELNLSIAYRQSGFISPSETDFPTVRSVN